jgi:hypothetical protein
MRTSIAIVLLLGCGGGSDSKTEAPGSGSAAPVAKAGSGSGSAAGSGRGSAAPAKTACLPTDGDRGLDWFTADDKTATICTAVIGEGDKQPTCIAVDLATGAWSSTAKPAPPAPPKGKVDLEVKQDQTAVQVCEGSACKKLDVPPPKLDEEGKPMTYLTAVSEDHKHAVVAADPLKGAWFFDATTGKKLRTIPLVDGGGCMDSLAFLGDLVYIAVNVCAGPGAQGKVYSWDGKVVASIEGVNPYGSSPIQLGPDTWAFADLNGGAIAVFDAKAKKSRALEIPRNECDDCYALGAAPVGGDVALIQTASGKLVDLAGTSVAVVDAEGSKILAQYKIPPCPTPKKSATGSNTAGSNATGSK